MKEEKEDGEEREQGRGKSTMNRKKGEEDRQRN